MNPMQIPNDSDRSYQIFKREADNTTVCVEVVKGLDEARKRIEQARSVSPESEHFIFDPLTQKTIDPAEPSITTDPLTP
jgi:hypothetical protein